MSCGVKTKKKRNKKRNDKTGWFVVSLYGSADHKEAVNFS